MAKKTKRPELKHCKVRAQSHPTAPWRVSYKVERDGRPATVRKAFRTEDAAWDFAIEQDNEIANHGIRYGDIPPEARRAFDYFRDASAELSAIGATVPTFEELVNDALAAIRTRHHEQSATAIPVAEAVEAFTAYKASRVGKRQIADLRNRLKRFAEDHGARSMRDITTAEIEAWLASLRSRRNPDKKKTPPPLGPLARNHYRAILHAFFKYGATPARAWVERNPVADLEPERVESGEPEAYTPEDTARIMQTALDHHPHLVPVLALGMFCGLRTSEAIGTDLAKLPREPGEFRTTGKTGRRMAPLTEAALAWLTAQPRRKGMAWVKSERQFYEDLEPLFIAAKVAPIDNGARHSFITYRTAELRDVARVADECGNSVSTIKNHYRQLVTSEAAAAFFAIRPEAKAANVTDISEGRASA